MLRLWILVLSLALLTGSTYGSLAFWLGLPRLIFPPVIPPAAAPIVITGPPSGGAGGVNCGGNGLGNGPLMPAFGVGGIPAGGSGMPGGFFGLFGDGPAVGPAATASPCGYTI